MKTTRYASRRPSSDAAHPAFHLAALGILFATLAIPAVDVEAPMPAAPGIRSIGVAAVRSSHRADASARHETDRARIEAALLDR